ncbi:hypothetical protein ONS95_010808 [Cadophora gregata]|uniref:uncharacterized protein n=1 Tax=Cadophora gregata TaxID=51156 RepID=UPI0026DBAC5E|nr:uncharacterized protein ONS95_010808 [Cadophora gregata]KAK0119356.1 hypothetical protein ONS95_010808 [Cadophora gregata]KAK0120389.1 hypothetical protein ONS96_010605 [Cadophora gregata f. sp. sojae]
MTEDLSPCSTSHGVRPATTVTATASPMTTARSANGQTQHNLKQKPTIQTEGQEQVSQEEEQGRSMSAFVEQSARNHPKARAEPSANSSQQFQPSHQETPATHSNPTQRKQDLELKPDLELLRKQRRNFIRKVCVRDRKNPSWISNSMTADEINLFKLDISFIEAPQNNPSLPILLEDDSSSTVFSDCDESDDSPATLSLDSRFIRVTYVSQQIASFLDPPRHLRGCPREYPNWAGRGITFAKGNEDCLAMVTCNIGEPGANEILRSELVACIHTANMIIFKASPELKNSPLEGRVISVTLQSLRVIHFRIAQPKWLYLNEEGSRLQIDIQGYDLDASLAWENQLRVNPAISKILLE